MCFAPQRRALFPHRHLQKWSEPLVFCTFWLGMCFVPQRRALFRHLNLQKWSEPLVFWTFWLRNVLRATPACIFSTSEPPKVVRTPSVLNILTSKWASRHNGMHFFDIWTSKSGPNPWFFFNILTWKCLFRHLKCQKWSAPLVLYILTCKCASRHNGVHFFDIWTSKSGPNP